MPKKLINELAAFIANPYPNNRWISGKNVQVYVRKSTRFIRAEKLILLDLASIEVTEQARGKGLFKEILAHFQKVCPWDGILLENVHNPRLNAHMSLKKEWENYGELKENFLWRKPV